MTGTVITLGRRDWARTRFVGSTVWEASQAARTLTHRRRQLPHRAWLDAIDAPAATRRLPVLAALHPDRGWVPDFLTPEPTPLRRAIDADLAAVAATARSTVIHDLQRSLNSHPTVARRRILAPLIADPPRALAAVTAELQRAWDLLVAPFWPVVEELIDADIAHRSREITRVGLGPVVEELSPAITGHPGGVVVAGLEPVTISTRGHGLALMPSAFVWPDLVLIDNASYGPALVYPARGVGSLWTAPATAPAGLAGVLGPTRAQLLTTLTRPATTTALASRLGLSPAAVSGQLHRLRAARLISPHRSGKEVFYRRTPAGDALLAAAGGIAQ